MGRGGGVVAGTKHSAQNEKHESSSSSGKADPKVTGVLCFIGGVIFLILAIAVPIAMVADPAGESCSPAEGINRKEQAVCNPTSYDNAWIADFGEEGKPYAKVYKAANNTLNFTETSFTWLNYETKLKGSYDYFSFSFPYYIHGRFMVYCDGGKCDHLRMYLLTKAEFNAAVDSNDEFNVKKFEYDYKDFKDEEWNYFTYYAYGPDYYYLVFALNKDKKVKIKYSIEMNQTAIDTTGMQPATCDGTRCKFDDMKSGDIMFIEYPTKDTYAECVDNPTIPEYFSVNLHNNKVSLGGAVAAGAILGIIAILCFVLGIIFILK